MKDKNRKPEDKNVNLHSGKVRNNPKRINRRKVTLPKEM